MADDTDPDGAPQDDTGAAPGQSDARQDDVAPVDGEHAAVADENERGDDDPAGAAPSRWRSALRWVFGRRLCFGGLVVGLVMFCLSLTPSLLPRGALFQGVVSGVSVAIGYGLGSAASAIVRRFLRSEPSAHTKSTGWRALSVSAVVLGVVFMWLGHRWQNNLRGLMDMPTLPTYQPFMILFVGLVVAALLLVISRLVRGGARLLISFGARFIPPRVAQVGGVVTSVLLVAGLFTGVVFESLVTWANSTYSLVNDDTSSLVTQPTSQLRTGGQGSLVSWESLGTRGRDFTGDGGGPTVDEIEAFTGEPATEPIRAYVGLESADSVEERAALAVAELERTGAFDRSVLVVNTVTGTGWVDENVASAIEFMHGGDTAQVAMQYSYLPSWISFLVDQAKAEDAGRALVDAVTARVAELDESDRPAVLVFGESLGSFGAEAAFAGVDDLLERTDGALFVGPTFNNHIHNQLRSERDEGSPFWRSVIDGGDMIRMAVHPDDLTDPSLYTVDQWRAPRVVYLQNSSDPIGYFSFDLWYRRPGWLNRPRGPDVSNSMTWVPFVTFAQVAADMAVGSSTPNGHGHLYGENVVDGWVGVFPPAGWTDERTQDLRELIKSRADDRDARSPESS